MGNKEVVIIGAGISGLSAALELQKRDPEIQITLLEKSSRAGGVIQSESREFFFEKGPRTFKTSRNKALIELATRLGLKDELIPANDQVSHKYIWYQNKLSKMPSSPLGLLFSPLTKGVFTALLKERKIEPQHADETIYEFISRRFNSHVANVLFDPLVKGIYAGDIHKLSISACFPVLKKWERDAGSVVKGFLQSQKKKKEKLPIDASLFTFKQGIHVLIDRMIEEFSGNIIYDFEVDQLEFHEGKVTVSSGSGKITADHVILAGSLEATKKLVNLPEQFSALPLNVINVGYDQRVLPKQGFGYLVPSQEQESILGCAFDSVVFPQQNKREQETRLSVMGLNYVGEKEALQALEKHLGITAKPQFVSSTKYQEGIPQYLVGHEQRVKELQDNISRHIPQISLIGNYLSGVSMSDCIALAHQTVAGIFSRFQDLRAETSASISS